MTLLEIKENVERVTEISDLSNNTRYEYNVYARYIFWVICKKEGYSSTISSHYLGFSHASALRAIELHEQNMDDSDIYSVMYQKVYDACYGVNTGKINIPSKIINKLALLSPEEMEEFDDTRLYPFVRMKGYL